MTDDAMLSHDPDKGLTQGWQWDKKINIFSVLALIAAVAAWVFALSERVSVLEETVRKNRALVEAEVVTIRERDAAISRNQDMHYQEIIRRLERIEDGLSLHINNAEHNKK